MPRQLRFASIGNANIDLTLRVEKLPEADVILQASECFIGTGGSASNYAYAVAKMGGKAHFFGAVGDDVFGRYFIEELSSQGVDTSHVEILAGCATGVVTIWLDPSGEKRGVAYRGANLRLTPKPEWDVLNEMDMVHLAGCAPNVARWVWDNVKAPKSFDPGSSIHLYSNQDLLEGLKRCRVTYLPASKVHQLSEDALKSLFDGGGVLVEKMGFEGVRIRHSEGAFRVKPPKVRAVDTTGAGDVFSAVFDFKLASGESLLEAALWATAASTLKIARMGAKSGIPSHRELEAYMGLVRAEINVVFE